MRYHGLVKSATLASAIRSHQEARQVCVNSPGCESQIPLVGAQLAGRRHAPPRGRTEDPLAARPRGSVLPGSGTDGLPRPGVGVEPILVSKFQAAWYNLYVMLGPWAYLVPVAVLGAWQGWHDRRLRLWLAHGLALTLGFTFPAQHGSAFHSASALVIWQAACIPAGIAAVMRWLARRWLRWDALGFTRFFLIRLTALAVVVSLIWLRIIRPELATAGYDSCMTGCSSD